MHCVEDTLTFPETFTVLSIEHLSNLNVSKALVCSVDIFPRGSWHWNVGRYPETKHVNQIKSWYFACFIW